MLLWVGCSSPKGTFQTKSDPAYQGKLLRVLIAYYPQDTKLTLGRDFSERFVRHLTALLAQRNVPAEAVRLDQNALDRDAPVKAAALRFRPRQFLSFAVTRVNSRSAVHRVLPGELPHFDSEMSVSLEFNLTDALTGRPFWRGEARFNSLPVAEDVADQLLEQVVAARLL